jgi:hypothetical protein
VPPEHQAPPSRASEVAGRGNAQAGFWGPGWQKVWEGEGQSKLQRDGLGPVQCRKPNRNAGREAGGSCTITCGHGMPQERGPYVCMAGSKVCACGVELASSWGPVTMCGPRAGALAWAVEATSSCVWCVSLRGAAWQPQGLEPHASEQLRALLCVRCDGLGGGRAVIRRGRQAGDAMPIFQFHSVSKNLSLSRTKGSSHMPSLPSLSRVAVQLCAFRTHPCC